MASVLNDEEILCSINSYKDIKASSKVANTLVNLLAQGVAGGVVNDFKLILTPKNLYIQAITHAVWGGLSDIAYTDKISRENIKSFNVKNEDAKEYIEIITKDDKVANFIRDNEKKNDLALVMSSILKEGK
ncbi:MULTISPECIES: hypothetical protein [Clostridium]|jgi:outer membrane lipoprotein SlyB|uniref:Outer membrane lipoprotein SlyB n=3 Tax=Clostridium TaxID=1485 RepID=A0A1S8PUH5_CLOBE|nr:MULTISPECIES: hypothetical protein [Clostridium]AQS06774.1 hypothetical protein CLBIJ_42210 [Clostridium beijerinckii]AVK47952.1 hypothetical protein AXY43_07890 [Clostridium sp. MF28]MBA2887609.1 outer membrane lipoprotein SlyB [Clostridium beijerinckii]MBA2901573.1 outer membrane lipoprotein SlyB [Clostridium beijerinckii]MBA2911540.1 outer membrane lipoprotein SlyB [Clostridium beijerinckii]